LQIEQKGSGGMARFQGFQGVRRGIDDDGQLVIEVVRGGGGNGTGAIGVSQSFHTRMLAGERGRFGAVGVEALLESTKNKKMFVSLA
jgi:hypothetical protein